MNVNDYIALLCPWEFGVEQDGVHYPTRRPTLGDIVVLDSLRSGKATLDSIRSFVESIFVDQKPNIASWDPNVMGLVLRDYAKAAVEYLRKNQQTLLPKMASPSAAAK